MAESSSSSSIILQAKYDIFLSFRGEDTRDNFVSHLYAALCRKKIRTFIDNDGLKKGDEISPMLMKGIEESKISVIIFSKNYAFSKWCLDELVKILQCKKLNNQMVIPVYYNISPFDVQKQARSLEDAFVKHHECSEEMTEKVQKWRAALTEATSLSGWDSTVIRIESNLVDKVVEDILDKLNIPTLDICKGLVGLNLRIKKIKSLLCIGLLDFRVVGIWGMGGIGKTTLAGCIFNQISKEFEGCSFNISIREESAKYGLFNLREKIYSQILGEENLKICTPNLPQYIQERLQRKKVFIVLDDVNDLEQLEVLAGGLDRFSLGSRIIITTRDKQVLYSYGVYVIYEVEELNDNESLQLFCDYAFKHSYRTKDLLELSYKILPYAKGNPLALKVMGSSLCQKSKQDWESALSNLKHFCDVKIYDVLKISYDGLKNEEKNIFLDIACFFKGESRCRVIEILDGCYNFSTQFCLSILVNKSLISESENNELEMHDLLQAMGHEIICQESYKHLGKRSRLWNHTDVYRILKYNEGTDLIEGIFLDMSKIRDLQLSNRAFTKMSNLRLLKFYNNELDKKSEDISKVHLPRGLKYLPDELSYFHWDGYSSKKLPSKFSLENLVELSLPYSKIKQLWKGTKYPSKLKYINLHHSKRLTGIPDLSNTVKLEVINLDYCKSLVDVHSSIQSLSNLHYLYLSGCENLRSFSGKIHFQCLEILNLSNCKNLTKFPEISGNIRTLILSGTAIEEVPSSISCLTNLATLFMENCTRLKRIPTSICKLKSLEWLKISYCSNLESFPEILEEMECLKFLQLNGATTIKELPNSFGYLNGLVNLGLNDCKNLEIIPSSICDLTSLRNICLSGCSKLKKLPENLGNLINLNEIEANRTDLSQLPSSVACWKQISYLKLAFCKLTEIPEDLCCVLSLVELDLRGNNFESLPSCMKQLSQLKHLYLSNCNNLQSLPELPLRLKDLEATYCTQLRSLPELHSSLEEVDSSDLKIISGRRYMYAQNRIHFVFTNCQNLNENANNILRDGQKRFQNMATASLRYRDDEVHKETPAISFCVPGSEIPDWISYRNSGYSLTMELPENWFDRSFIGFALCVVIEFEGIYYGDLHVRCDYSFETNDGDRVDFCCWLTIIDGENSDVSIERDHVLLGYDPCFHAKLLNCDHTIASFEFEICNWASPNLLKFCKLKCCGACPLYAQPNKDFGETVHHSDVNGSRSRSGTSNEEEVEPHPKRICRNKIKLNS